MVTGINVYIDYFSKLLSWGGCYQTSEDKVMGFIVLYC